MIQPTLKHTGLRLERGFCGCGAPAEPPLAGCKPCYANLQESQRSRGRWQVGTIANNWDTGGKYRMAK